MISSLRAGGFESAIPVTEQVFGRPVDYIKVVCPEADRKISAGQLFSDPNAMYFAFNEGLHAYIAAGRVRLDGDFLSLANFNSRTDLLDRGVVFKLPLSPQKMAEIPEVFKNPSKFISLHCVSSACHAATAISNLRFDGVLTKFFGTSVLKQLLFGGLRDQNNERVHPEIFLINSESLAEMVGDMKSQQRIRVFALATVFSMLSGLYGSALYDYRQGRRQGELDPTHKARAVEPFTPKSGIKLLTK